MAMVDKVGALASSSEFPSPFVFSEEHSLGFHVPNACCRRSFSPCFPALPAADFPALNVVSSIRHSELVVVARILS